MIAWRNANSLFRCQLNGNRYIVTTHPLAFNLVTHLIEVWKVEIEWQVILWDTIFRGEITGFDDSSDWIAILNWKWQPDVLLNVPLIIILCYMKSKNAEIYLYFIFESTWLSIWMDCENWKKKCRRKCIICHDTSGPLHVEN